MFEGFQEKKLNIRMEVWRASERVRKSFLFLNVFRAIRFLQSTSTTFTTNEKKGNRALPYITYLSKVVLEVSLQFVESQFTDPLHFMAKVFR